MDRKILAGIIASCASQPDIVRQTVWALWSGAVEEC
jgi:hypothetical protein